MYETTSRIWLSKPYAGWIDKAQTQMPIRTKICEFFLSTVIGVR